MLSSIGKTAWVLGIVTWYLIRIRFERKTKRVQVVAHSRSVADRAGLFAATLGLGAVPGLYAATGSPRWADYTPRLWALALGAAVYGIALWLFWRSHKDLGRNWSITLEIREQHRLVSNGVYRLIRHPMYSAFWMMAAGQALLLPNWVAGLSGLLGFAFLFFLRVGKEEAMMLRTFDDEYRSYMARTKRVFPYLY